MKLIIEIPDHLYKLLKDLPSDSNEGTIENVLRKAVENGIPYEPVTEFADRCRERGKIVNMLPLDVLDKIKGYVDHIRHTGIGKEKSLKFIEKFIEGLKEESEKV